MFIVAQLLGAAAATLLFGWLLPPLHDIAPSIVVPHAETDRRGGRARMR
jgi:hypothetical protein